MLSPPQVNPEDLSNDADPKFLGEFYKNLKILSQDLYKKSAVTHAQTTFGGVGLANPRTPAAGMEKRNGTAGKKLRSSFGGSVTAHEIGAAAAFVSSTMLDDALGTSASEAQLARTNSAANMAQQPADYFTSESMFDRMKQYAQQGGIPLDYMDRYAAYTRSQQQQMQGGDAHDE